MHRGWKRVVTRLTHVDMVVGVNGLLRTQRATDQLNTTVRNHFVKVHVGLCARTCLPHIQRKLSVQLTADDFIGHLLNQLTLPGGQAPSFGVHNRSRFFHKTVSVINLFGHLVMTNIEVNQATLCLRTPIMIGRHLHLADTIELLAQACCG